MNRQEKSTKVKFCTNENPSPYGGVQQCGYQELIDNTNCSCCGGDKFRPVFKETLTKKEHDEWAKVQSIFESPEFVL